uniref:Tesmin/TSO1-like CXC domain-containing protein n=1 Tax=Eptatretus burgeri TaxID=7764 RepID=A0A8C4Q915_EPTBU
MTSCWHEEADTRMVVHVLHAWESDYKAIQIRSVDTDVLVIFIGKFHQILERYPDSNISVALGFGKDFKIYPLNTVCEKVGLSRSRCLHLFHALTGSDTSAFVNKGKVTAWHAWDLCPELTQTFHYLCEHPFIEVDTDSLYFRTVERFTVKLYDRTCASESVNEARLEIFLRTASSLDRLPPTQDSLYQHFLRAVYQAGVWLTSGNSRCPPSPDGFGWIKDDSSSIWRPVWITLQVVSQACRELIKCCCKKSCAHCKCAKSSLPGTSLCKCQCKT